MPFQLIDLHQLLLKRVLEPLILRLQFLDLIEQLHLVGLQCGILKDQTLMLVQPFGLEGDYNGLVALHQRRVSIVDIPAHLLDVRKELLLEIGFSFTHNQQEFI